MMHLRNILAAFSLALCGTALAVEIQDMTELAAAPAIGDLLIIVDVSDTTDDAAGTGKRITTANLFAYTGSFGGNSATVTTADAAGDTTTFPMLATAATGSLAPATDAGLSYNATTDALTFGSGIAASMASPAGSNYAVSATAPAATTGASVAGKAVTVTASNAVASTDTAGAAAGGSVTITAGNAARNTSGNANGGSITLGTGTGVGTGTAGQVLVPQGVAAAPGVAGSVDPDTGIAFANGGMNHYVGGLGILGVGGAGLTAIQTSALDITSFRHIALLYGNIQQVSGGGANMIHGHVQEAITLSTSGTTTDSAADLLPAGAIILSVTCRVNTTITTATAWAVGDATTSQRFVSNNSTMTAGTTAIGLNQMQGSVTTDAAGPVQAAAAKLRITTTGTPGAGVIRCSVFYVQFTAPVA